MLTGIALFRLHAQGEENLWRTMSYTSSQMWNSFCQESAPQTWPAWHLAKLKTARLWFEWQTRCSQAVCVCVCVCVWLGGTQVVARPFVFTAAGASLALQVDKSSLKLHRSATLPRASRAGRVGSIVRVHWSSPAGFCCGEAKVSSGHKSTNLSFSRWVGLGGTYRRSREKQVRAVIRIHA